MLRILMVINFSWIYDYVKYIALLMQEKSRHIIIAKFEIAN